LNARVIFPFPPLRLLFSAVAQNDCACLKADKPPTIAVYIDYASNKTYTKHIDLFIDYLLEIIESHATSIPSSRSLDNDIDNLARPPRSSFNLITRAFSKHLLFSCKHERDANNYVNALPVPFIFIAAPT